MNRLLLLAIVGALMAGGCAADSRREVVVSAAASLTEAFAGIETEFERINPGVDIVINFGGSSALREQILAGAPADVFASANVSNMQLVEQEGLVHEDSSDFAGNRLVIAVPIGNPASVGGLDDFSDPDLLIGLCAAPVPCGDFARTALARAGVTPSSDTNEPNVRALLTKIDAGELDAGIVYATDMVDRGGSVTAIAIPDTYNVAARYSIAVLTGGHNVADAEAFVAFVLSGSGQAVLAARGFVSP